MTDEPASGLTPYGQYAGLATRLVAFIIDRLIVTGITTVVLFVAQFALETFGINAWLSISQLAQVILGLLVFVVIILIAVSYNLGFWLLVGQTPGKRIMGVRIVRTNGERLRFRDAVVRYVGYWVSAILFLGYLWILVDNRRQGFHDKMARTLVIYSWPEPEDWEAETPIRDRIRARRQSRLGTSN